MVTDLRRNFVGFFKIDHEVSMEWQASNVERVD